jgi:hypothetical protein
MPFQKVQADVADLDRMKNKYVKKNEEQVKKNAMQYCKP